MTCRILQVNSVAVNDSKPAAQPPTTAAAPAWPGPRTLEYSIPRQARPGLVTAIGVISIVLGSLGMLRSLWQMLSLVGMLFISQMSFPMVATAPGGGVTPAGTLAVEDADVIVAALNASQALSAGDQTRMAAALLLADTPLAPPAAGEPWTQAHVAKQITGAATTGSSITYTLAGGTISLDAAKIEVISTAGGAGMSTTTISATGGVSGFSMAGNPFSGISPRVLAAGFGVEVLNLGLAILLLIAGIATLRASPRSPKLHRWWALLKLPAIALSTVVGIWQAFAFLENFGMTTTQTTGGATVTTPVFGGSIGWLMIIPSIGMALVACVYPIVVLFIFRAPSLRAYYENELGAQNA